MTAKGTRFSITVFPEQYRYFTQIPHIVAEWGWNTEIAPTTGKEHRQMYLRTHQQQRVSAIMKLFPGAHIEIARDWPALVNYCKKAESRKEGSEPHHEVSQLQTMYTYAQDIVNRLPPLPRIRDDYYEYLESISIQMRATRSGYDKPILDIDTWIYEKVIKHYIADDIIQGRPGVEWISVNPAFISMLRQHGRNLINARHLAENGPV